MEIACPESVDFIKLNRSFGIWDDRLNFSPYMRFTRQTVK